MQDENTPGERWLPVVGHEGYEVSDLGRVRSYLKSGKGARRVAMPHVLVPLRRAGYHAVHLRAGPVHAVHRLVLEAFVGPRPEGMQACHGNGNAADNRLANLRWGTVRDNFDDKIRHRSGAGERSPRARLTWDTVRTIRAAYASGNFTQTELARAYGIPQGHVSGIVRGKSWREP